MPRAGVWPESVLYDQSGSGGSIVGRSFEIGKLVKYAGLNCDQAGFDAWEKPRASAAHRAQTVPPRKPWTSRKSDCEKSRCVSSVGAEKMDWLIGHSWM